MEHVRIEDVDSWMSPASAKRPLSNALGAEDVTINHYELAPGESFAFGYHQHEGQEEVFYVLEGTATFETDEGEVRVAQGEAVRFAPGEWQRGTNETDERVLALAIGAPAEMGETTILRECEDCGERTEQAVQPTEEKDALVTVCEDCGAETGRFD
ncbi:cupin domain-containing protein [Haloglomus halophilum]|uniref:cupin domain-containing protein n=1 Tax=Haloglomus halophilum TaxID=2962672 RepID=UPI0020C9AA69|nr:cupin domain-containing protein [Haloglomus halophilum]